MSSANVVKIGGCTEIIDTGGRLDLLEIREEQQKVFRWDLTGTIGRDLTEEVADIFSNCFCFQACARARFLIWRVDRFEDWEDVILEIDKEEGCEVKSGTDGFIVFALILREGGKIHSVTDEVDLSEVEKYKLSSSNKRLKDIWRLISNAEFFDCIARSCIRSKKLNFVVRKISRESNSGEKGLATAESEFDIAGIEKIYIWTKNFPRYE